MQFFSVMYNLYVKMFALSININIIKASVEKLFRFHYFATHLTYFFFKQLKLS